MARASRLPSGRGRAGATRATAIMQRLTEAVTGEDGGVSARIPVRAMIVLGILSAPLAAICWMLVTAYSSGYNLGGPGGSDTPLIIGLLAIGLCLAALLVRAFAGGMPRWMALAGLVLGAALALFGAYKCATEPYDWPFFIPALTLGGSLLAVTWDALRGEGEKT